MPLAASDLSMGVVSARAMLFARYCKPGRLSCTLKLDELEPFAPPVDTAVADSEADAVAEMVAESMVEADARGEGLSEADADAADSEDFPDESEPLTVTQPLRAMLLTSRNEPITEREYDIAMRIKPSG